MNIGGGYFMTQGKALFSQVWFNHQPFMGYLSYIIQTIFQPINIYELLLRHFQFLMVFSFIASFFIIKRFGWAGLGFVVVYELSKFYIFGNRFLGESLVAYVLVYMVGLIWLKYSDKPIYKVEYIASAIMLWFVLFTREPFSLTALAAYAILLWKPKEIYKKISLAVLAALTSITLLLQPFQEYFYNLFVVTSNATTGNELQNNLAGEGVLKVFFYPLFVIFDAFTKQFNEFWMLLTGLCVLFIIASIYVLVVRKKYWFIAVLYLLLGLTNLRYLPFGETYYSAFHIIPWFAMVVFSTWLVILDKFGQYKKFCIPLVTIFIGVFILYMTQPNTFFKHPADPQRDLLVNYGEVMNVGSIVNTLSAPQNTLFIDRAGANDSMALAYFTAQRPSSYAYSWYVYFAPGYPRYTQARGKMFQVSPPDFYYSGAIDKDVKKNYQQLFINNKPSKLYVKKAVYQKISQDRFQKAKEHGLTK